MDTNRETIAREIQRLRRCHEHLLAQTAGCREAPILWELSGHTLLWRVFLDDVLEPDVDVEILSEVIVVRGALDSGASPRYHALLPLPAPYAAAPPQMRFVAGILEVRIECSR